jgi:hypothetical protein
MYNRYPIPLAFINEYVRIEIDMTTFLRYVNIRERSKRFVVTKTC